MTARGTRDEVLARLRAAGAAGVSGEQIAAELAISRAAVAKHVAALRDSGYAITAVAGAGYRLVSAPDLPLPGEVAPLVIDPFWVRVEGGEATGSTNDDARTLARAGAPEGAAVVAGRQTAGRARLGRTWESPEGGVYLSMVLRPALAPVSVAPLSLVVGLGVARALEGFGLRPQVKWPNDVLLHGAKVAGVLLEMSAEADRVDWVVAGVGINVASPVAGPVPGAAYVADAMGDAGRTPTRPAVAAAVLDAVAGTYRSFVAGGFDSLCDAWVRRDALAGSHVVVRDAVGSEIATGRAAGVDADGRLLVESPDGAVVSVPAGEVTLRDPRT